MSDNQDALKLADALEQQFPIGTAQHYLDGEAAAELRRLHDLVTEDSILLRRQRDEIAQLKVLNAELVEALQLALSSYGVMMMGNPPQEAWDVWKVEEKARAALAKWEASK